jgi:hypothetical protein
MPRLVPWRITTITTQKDKNMKTLFLTLLVTLGVFTSTARLESNETPRDPIAWIIDETDNATIYNSMIRTLDISALRGKYKVVEKIDYSKVQNKDRVYFLSTKSGSPTIYAVVKSYIEETYSGSNYYFTTYSGLWYGSSSSPDTDKLKNIGSDIAQQIAEHYLQ